MNDALRKKLPESPGVYLMRDAGGRILYIGKAGNLRRRVSAYFLQPQDYKIENLLSRVKKIDYEKTDTAIEALILESRLIKKFEPQFNVKEKDDKSFLYVEITGEKFPRVLLSRGRGNYGPFTSALSIREALRIIRRIFPYSTHRISDVNARRSVNEAKNNSRGRFRILRTEGQGRRHSRACFDYEIGLCPGTCAGLINRRDYMKNIKNIKLFFEGKKGRIIKSLNREMIAASRKLDFEKAEELRRQIFALQHIQDVALIGDGVQRPAASDRRDYRIEGYDISNISGTSAVGAMAVFQNGKPDKKEYRKFRIKTVFQSDDVGMLREVLYRRFRNDWPLPHLILIDGGMGQVNAAKNVLAEAGLKIPVIGIAKGMKRKNNKIIGRAPADLDKKILIRVRNEAHRFAVRYHQELRSRKMFKE